MFFIMLAVISLAIFNCYVYCVALEKIVFRGWVAVDKALRNDIREGRLRVRDRSDAWINLLCFRAFKQARRHGIFKTLLWKRILKPRVKAYLKAMPYVMLGIVGWLALIAWSLLASWNLWEVVIQAAYVYLMGGVA